MSVVRCLRRMPGCGERDAPPERLDAFASQAEAAFVKIMQFWSVETERHGKLAVELLGDLRGHSTSVFHREGGKRVVSVHGIENPGEMIHKMTHALFFTDDKLIRNMMGIPMEIRFGNPLSFPLCGRNLDAWASALRRSGDYIPLEDLGERHEDWGMSFVNRIPMVSDRKRQHASYIEAGSFGDFLIRTYGTDKVKAFYHASLEQGRPWEEVFGSSFSTLETGWLKYLDGFSGGNAAEVSALADIWSQDPSSACFKTQGVEFRIRKPFYSSGPPFRGDPPCRFIFSPPPPSAVSRLRRGRSGLPASGPYRRPCPGHPCRPSRR